MNSIPCLFCGRKLVSYAKGLDLCYFYRWWTSDDVITIRCQKRNIDVSIKPDVIKKWSSCHLPTLTLLNKGFKI